MNAEISPSECCVLNAGAGAWAFEPLARELSGLLGIEISETPRQFNYLLHFEDPSRLVAYRLFVPMEAIALASDKRLIAECFDRHAVPSPITRLFREFQEVAEFVRKHPQSSWCLKYPTSCGANGHRMVVPEDSEPVNWPKPFIVQEFIKLERPEVYRIYCAGGELFGWITRRYPEGSRVSPWVAHAQGARYVSLGTAPEDAMQTARLALEATGLLGAFGCVDLMQRPGGEWVALEVGTDGLFNHVDREVDDAGLTKEMNERIEDAFWKAARRAW